MSYFLIGIGGTGARCIEAFIHLNAAGLLNGEEKVHLIYVDADVSCGNLVKTQVACTAYNKAVAIGYVENTVFKNELNDYNARVWQPIDDGQKNMDIIYQNETMKNSRDDNDKSLAMLYESLFTKQERTTSLSMGFRGHPAIGASIINLKLDKDDLLWKDIIQDINSDKEPKVFLMGSVFGGTGAAGIPNIAKKLKKEINIASGRCVALISAALVLPYFQIPQADEKNRREMQAKTEEFILNTKYSLDYYNKHRLIDSAEGVFDCIYTIGDDVLTSVDTFALGAAEQKNTPNYIEMYAALAAIDFFNCTDIDNISSRVFMVGRNNEDNKIQWEDLPNSLIKPSLLNKLSTFAIYLYIYQTCVFPSLQAIHENQELEKNNKWYIDLFKKSAKFDLHETTNEEKYHNLELLAKYSRIWFEWMNDIVSNNQRLMELFDKNLYNKAIQHDAYLYDAMSITLPKKSGEITLTYIDLWKKLCHIKHKKNSSTDLKSFMSDLYNIASIRG